MDDLEKRIERLEGIVMTNPRQYEMKCLEELELLKVRWVIGNGNLSEMFGQNRKMYTKALEILERYDDDIGRAMEDYRDVSLPDDNVCLRDSAEEEIRRIREEYDKKTPEEKKKLEDKSKEEWQEFIRMCRKI